MKYYIRLDDACERMNVANWKRIERILDKHNITPLVGIIPCCEDEKMNIYDFNSDFWNIVNRWAEKKWIIAMHGYNHVYSSNCGGLNPINYKSEFAGMDYRIQAEKIKKGIECFSKRGIEPKVFFAPSHTFDENTLKALKNCSSIRIISDTIANASYLFDGFTFVPQQSGRVRFLFLKEVTFCYHPNSMKEDDFVRLDSFIKKHRKLFYRFPTTSTNRRLNNFDKFLKWLYFAVK